MAHSQTQDREKGVMPWKCRWWRQEGEGQERFRFDPLQIELLIISAIFGKMVCRGKQRGLVRERAAVEILKRVVMRGRSMSWRQWVREQGRQVS